MYGPILFKIFISSYVWSTCERTKGGTRQYISHQGGKLAFKLYSKPTDKHSYLQYDSITFSQFLRIRRICTEMSEFDISQGYSMTG